MQALVRFPDFVNLGSRLLVSNNTSESPKTSTFQNQATDFQPAIITKLQTLSKQGFEGGYNNCPLHKCSKPWLPVASKPSSRANTNRLSY